MLEKIINWVKANWLSTLLATIGFIFFIPRIPTLLSSIFIAIVLESVILLLFKNIIRFIVNDTLLKDLFVGEDGIFSKNETLGFAIFQGLALISVHLLIGLVIIGLYFTL